MESDKNTSTSSTTTDGGVVHNNHGTTTTTTTTKKRKDRKEKKGIPIDFSVPLREQPTEEESAAHTKCMFWMVIKMKHRALFCNQPRAKGSTFCTHHRPLDECSNTDDPTKKRIPCPLNPAHIIYESKLKKHLKGCPNAKETQSNAHITRSVSQVYYNENLNGLAPKFNDTPLSHISTEQLNAMANKLDTLFATLFPTGIKVNDNQHESLEKIFSENVNSKRKLKHIQQESSILSVLQMENLLEKDNIFLEFGAGTGKLGYHVFQALDKSSGHIMIDRMKFKSLKKSDRMIKNEKDCKYFDRFLIDIRHLDLSKVEQLEKSNFVIISKHLCGCATDFTLRCLANSITNNEKLRQTFAGIGIATCCHHVCTLDSYINPKYVNDVLQLTPDEFQLLCSITSWASIEPNKKKSKKAKLDGGAEDNDDDQCPEVKQEMEAIKQQTLNSLVNYDSVFETTRKEELGYKAKRLIDYGRYLFIRDTLLLEPTLQLYTQHSKENMFISATTKNKPLIN
ncbi:hypothetical protein SAMD00019534_014870 [Acytostelium subglobosum LB1]|uniref:hypothetical protein n=1 Tax=Acytostelium subglobosum LB1 TaxID=1410327 RepID=UPI000644E52D|nr:hypothetical protein SAMD00019534_014870 [Acytostelium subglobosum LB1]GAM18312.1 hypothetical protein SAMD00019534_014870 [Acytostelium subglobosum LB1]|eukprot:XP_012757532.1 hypothetical protein SAMD00019534_014870 [Acytostelium subglobosum LB1]